MTDLEMRAAMRVLGFLTGPALYTDIHLYHLHFCKMVKTPIRRIRSGCCCTRRERPRGHTAEERDDLAPFQLSELHADHRTAAS